ncbi:thioesterase/thiol ester dehydrase-isomerase superfamily protein [Artemisia annua]|uniref:Thioesterase/thiol ester dehydrase-isomerase superfamily protein n=1 Tax=Artemisia annua TaxID=35608 RepID=A0A2U1KTN8_ARTAN|nr:thioesterase/thiol ester dehydrase-isomerase superfamily protein [Artemisia annua]
MKTLIRFISITTLTTRNTKHPSLKQHNLIIHNHITTRSYSNEKQKQPISIAPTVSSPSPSPDGVSAIDAGTSMRKPISLWPGMYHSPVTNALWQARNVIFDNAGSCDGNGVVNKSPGDSRTTILYPFSTDYILREQYRNPWNGIRVGKLLEDLDALAGTISFKHCFNHAGMADSLLLVTASVDKMVIKKPILVDNDLKILGAVTWVGRSSMEIQLEVIQSTEGLAVLLFFLGQLFA